MQLIEYKQGTELHNYQADMIVENVPINYFDGDIDAIKYYEKHKNNKAWKKRNEEILDNFNPAMLGEIFYCLKCQRMEDGAHRRIIAREKGIEFVNVRTGSDCYKNYVKAGRLLRGDSTFIETLSKLIDENPDRHRLDKKWLMASASDKWPFIIKNVDFRGKSFLDVGCNVGYSVFRAWSLMASHCCGVDIRSDIIAKADELRYRLCDNELHNLKFYNLDLFDLKDDNDIVACMGLLHYLPINSYREAFSRIASKCLCNKTLILELRLKKGRKDIALEIGSGGQTLPTEEWLHKKLADNGFDNPVIYNRPKDRALWICKRGAG